MTARLRVGQRGNKVRNESENLTDCCCWKICWVWFWGLWLTPRAHFGICVYWGLPRDVWLEEGFLLMLAELHFVD